jgi:hypothetical protein
LESGELVDLQLTGALLCVDRLLDSHNLVAGGCVLRGTEDHVHLKTLRHIQDIEFILLLDIFS